MGLNYTFSNIGVDLPHGTYVCVRCAKTHTGTFPKGWANTFPDGMILCDECYPGYEEIRMRHLSILRTELTNYVLNKRDVNESRPPV